MKFAILFALAAFAFLAQAQAQSSSNSINRDTILEGLKEKLEALKEKLDKLVEKALNKLKDIFTKVNAKVEHLMQQLKDKAQQVRDKVSEAAQKILDKLDAQIHALLPGGSQEGIAECIAMKETVHQSVMALIANTSYCINNKIDEAESYVADIYSTSTEAVDKIMAIKDEGDECIKDISGIKEITAATVCLTKTSAKGSLVVAKAIATVTKDFAKLTFKISTLPVTVPTCVSTKALVTVAEEAKEVVESIKDCINEKQHNREESATEISDF